MAATHQQSPRIEAPHVIFHTNLVNQVSVQTGYKPECIIPGESEVFKLGNTKPEVELKREVCSGCLVRLECLTDAINDLLGAGYKPSTQYSSGDFRAGMKAGDLVTIALGFHGAGISRVVIDQVEDIPMILPRKPPAKKQV